jgi:hypothetical protein
MAQTAESNAGGPPAVAGLVRCSRSACSFCCTNLPEEGFEPRRLRTLEDSAVGRLRRGVANFLMPGVQYVYFLGGMTIIVAPGLSQSAEVAWMLLFVAFLNVMLITPIVLFAALHERIRPGLNRMKSWLGRNGARLAGGILAFFGVYLSCADSGSSPSRSTHGRARDSRAAYFTP